MEAKNIKKVKAKWMWFHSCGLELSSSHCHDTPATIPLPQMSNVVVNVLTVSHFHTYELNTKYPRKHTVRTREYDYQAKCYKAFAQYKTTETETKARTSSENPTTATGFEIEIETKTETETGTDADAEADAEADADADAEDVRKCEENNCKIANAKQQLQFVQRYFWHITDLHLDTIYSTQGDVLRSCWRIDRQAPSSSNRSPGRFGDYLCDSPWSLIESAAKAMKSRQGDNVEFVLWTGDGLSHSSHPLFETKKLEIMRNITDLLGRTFSSQFVFPVLGHEDGTTTNFRHMGELWRHWLPTEALHTFEKGGYYSIEQTKSRLRIIALNTNFMRHDPKYSQSHLAAVRQRTPPNTMMGGPETPEYKNYYYHHGTLHQHHSHSGDWSTGYGYNAHHRGISAIPGTIDGSNGGRVSALSEFENQDTEKQWIWLEDVLSKSKNNKELAIVRIVCHGNECGLNVEAEAEAETEVEVVVEMEIEEVNMEVKEVDMEVKEVDVKVVVAVAGSKLNLKLKLNLKPTAVAMAYAKYTFKCECV
ncbi:uncharacterized protein LOC119679742 [Teleopsis dalmanni]|uniref:uncharacterized protein LOC119679742 n=1 Tax=Teleopsis dalmanni TaxID=139649 RepID=UPI0018CF6CE9|nr:uncharacterized protein LOC119679742 [Teleopsis dalmanni]